MKNIGIDIISIDRIKNVYYRYSDKFLEKILTKDEIDVIKRIKNENRKIEKLAGIFAVKEAVIKCFNQKLSFKDIEIYYNELGKPFCKVIDKKVLVSISHEKKYAVAIAMLE